MSNPAKRWLFTLFGLALVVAAVLSYGREGPYPLLVISGPTDIERLEVALEDGEVLWSIASSEPRTLHRIVYGSVPKGFHQLIPAGDEPPRSLIVGEWLEAEIVSRDGTFYQQGPATSSETFQPTTSRMVLNRSGATLPD